jgi:ATP-dependent Clp protease ATP-binding subunit ClpX
METEPTALNCNNCNRGSGYYPDNVFLEDANSNLVLCDQCIVQFNSACQQIFSSQSSQNLISEGKLPTPIEILEKLNEHIVKQEDAKSTIAVAVAHHYRRLREPSIGKSNVLIIGPTGTGKTEIARTVAKFLNVPFASADASSFTAKGYIGDDPESMVRNLLVASNFNISQAETGIIFIDEIDKLGKKEGQDSGIGTTSVQQQLLTLLEGNKIQVKVPTPEGEEAYAIIDTSKILFICSGAFVGLEEIISDSRGSHKPIGINAEIKEAKSKAEAAPDTLKKIETKHLVKFGLIPELLGRIPVVTYTNQLNQDDLVKILTEPKESLIRKYKKLFEMDEVEVEFTEEFLRSVAKEAFDKKLGARGLRSVIEGKLKSHFLNVHEYKGKKLSL